MVAEISFPYVSILLATVVSMLVGSLWYAKPIFGKLWLEQLGRSQKKLSSLQQGGFKVYILAFLAHLLIAIVLAYFVQLAHIYSFLPALVFGAALWLGCILPFLIINSLFQKEKMLLTMIHAGHALAVLLVMMVVISETMMW